MNTSVSIVLKPGSKNIFYPLSTHLAPVLKIGSTYYLPTWLIVVKIYYLKPVVNVGMVIIESQALSEIIYAAANIFLEFITLAFFKC